MDDEWGIFRLHMAPDISFGGESAEKLLDSSDWDYEAELDLLKEKLSKSTGGVDRGRARKLIALCMKLNLGSEDEAKDELLKKPIAEEEEGRMSLSLAEEKCKINPLGIDLIQQKVLSYLPVKSLLTFRVVNQSLNSAVLPWLQEKIQKQKRLTVKENFAQFCSDFEKTEVLPLTKLGICWDNMTFEHCSIFFNKHGSQIRDLKIKERPSKELRNELSIQDLEKPRNIFRHVPNLKKLCLELKFLPEVIPEHFLFNAEELRTVSLAQVEWLGLSSLKPLSQGFLNGLFTMLPNVKVLQLGNFSDEQDWSVFVEALKKQKLKIHTIHRPSLTRPIGLWKALSSKGSPKLKELSMFLGTKKENSVLLGAQKRFLIYNATSLETLNLTMKKYGISNTSTLDFPAMKNLKSLTIRYARICDDYYGQKEWAVPVDSVAPMQLPNLQSVSLDIEALMNYGYGEFFSGESAFMSVTEINLGGWHFDYEEHELNVLPEISARFPNLKKLTNFKTGLVNSVLDLKTYAMELIVKNLSNIEELDLIIDDYGPHMKYFNWTFTGVSLLFRNSQWLLRQLADGLGAESMFSLLDPPGPSFRDLKKLRKLVLTFDSMRSGNTVINEMSVYLLFLRLSPKLHLTIRGDFSISEDLASKLTAHYEYISFNPSDPHVFKWRKDSSMKFDYESDLDPADQDQSTTVYSSSDAEDSD